MLTQRRFLCEFNLPTHGHTPSRNAILRCVRDFNERCTVSSTFHGRTRTVCLPENIERVGIAVQQRPHGSTIRHQFALQIWVNLRRFLPQHLTFHLQKLQSLQ